MQEGGARPEPSARHSRAGGDVGEAAGPIVAGLLLGGLGYAHTFDVLALVMLAAVLVFALT